MAKVTATIKSCPIIHNGKRYDIGATIELNETEVADIAIYLDNVQAVENGNKPTNKNTNKGGAKAETPKGGDSKTDDTKVEDPKDDAKTDDTKVEDPKDGAKTE